MIREMPMVFRQSLLSEQAIISTAAGHGRTQMMRMMDIWAQSNDVNTTYENCWAFKAGYLKDGTQGTGNGNGFKMGGATGYKT